MTSAANLFCPVMNIGYQHDTESTSNNRTWTWQEPKIKQVGWNCLNWLSLISKAIALKLLFENWLGGLLCIIHGRRGMLSSTQGR
ncbi:hypothetical protein CMV_030783 [Castanea mollissima]|uniref:Uncharacterized protein n=1 Tax=Castanea mollissima TaxID=60419 RepID=A0A8J4Q2R3_9ROSI|nr:hypothetical protein CMV_030783 [Castanea mollissima]